MEHTPALKTPPAPALFQWTARVYWEDTDAGGVVYFANYLKFFERSRTEWLRSLGVSQEEMRLQHQAQFVVADASIRYLAPARLDDLLRLDLHLLNTARVSLQLRQQAWREGQLLAESVVRVACVDTQRLRPCKIPPDLLGRLPPMPGPLATPAPNR
jgi:acyl-CoA thioester hydrolase